MGRRSYTNVSASHKGVSDVIGSRILYRDRFSKITSSNERPTRRGLFTPFPHLDSLLRETGSWLVPHDLADRPETLR
jgi:hypothetical protein